MSGFSAGWLALREAFDLTARNASAQALGLRDLGPRLRRGAEALEVVDLACGTGANLRFLAPRLGGAQRWTLIDHDPLLLAALPQALNAWALAQGHVLQREGEVLRLTGLGWRAEVRPLRIDLAADLARVPWPRDGLVTASALLDLVSAPWIDALLGHARAADAAALFALSVDGPVAWAPSLPDDAAIHRLFEADQARDKGFGPALGAAAAAHASRGLAARGYNVTQAASDWLIDARDGPQAHAMLAAMAEGEAGAALARDPSARLQVEAWKAQRLALLAQTRLRVGHRELLAVP